MKIAHVGDIHWGLGYPGPTPQSRFDDIARVADWMADKIIEEGCDIVLVAGDLFKDSRVFLDRASVEISAAVAWLRKLSEAGLFIVVVSGTPSHDAIAAYELIREMRIPNVVICTTPQVVHFETDENVANVACLPGINKSTIASKEEYSRLPAHELHQLITDRVSQAVLGLGAECNYNPSILLSHITCVGAEKGFEDLIGQQEPVLTKEAIEGGKFDLACLGHIHNPHQIQGLSVPTFYCGSPERLSFNEEHVSPGFYIHEFNDLGYYGFYFERTPSRRFMTIEHNLTDYSVGNLEEWYLNLANIYKTGENQAEPLLLPNETGSIIRLKYKVHETLAKVIDRGEVLRRLQSNGPFYIAGIEADVIRVARTRAVGASADISPLEALEMWTEVNGVSDEERGELGKRANLLMQEVGI